SRHLGHNYVPHLVRVCVCVSGCVCKRESCQIICGIVHHGPHPCNVPLFRALCVCVCVYVCVCVCVSCSYIVTGDSRGHVKFYDRMLKLISHFSDFNLDSISSLSFATKLPSAPKCPPDDCTLTAS